MSQKKRRPKIHCSKGAFVGGKWVSIEDCDEHYNIKNGSGECTKDCEACPRSRTGIHL